MKQKFFSKRVTAAFLPIIAASCLSFSGGGDLAREGAAAPDFSAKIADGRTIRLGEYAGRSSVLLYFYPKDDTQGCTKEACNIRDNIEALSREGIVVLGVSLDGAESHEAFSRKYHLNFPLLIDDGGRIAQAYGVPVTLGMARRVSFLIDKEGMIRKVFPSVDVSKHAADVIAAAQSMGLGGKSAVAH